MPGYWEAFSPGEGRRQPRADGISDAGRLSLNGRWRFRLSPSAAGTGGAFTERDFDDGDWDEIEVPSHWVLQPITPLAGGPARSLRGTSEGPLYTNTALPIPLDPPRVPTENPTGDYRIVFDVPDHWAAAVLRFQGVDSCAKVWLNGQPLGFSTGSRLPFEFDAPVVPGENVLAVRVHRWSSGTYLEDQDMWWLPGIFRDVELLERPGGAIDDHFVHAEYDHKTGLGTLRVDSSTSAVVEIPELGIRMRAGETATVPVEPWSAESPRLYTGTLSSTLSSTRESAGDRGAENVGETIELRVGFRTVAIVDGVLRVNGRRVLFRGVNRHEHDPDTGRALDRDTMIRDIVLMKRHNINAVRTSHYPPHPEFLRLCDEYGLWVVEECDLETHGFIYAGWEGNPPADPRWLPAMLDRTRRMVERDKNRPSVVVWSMANESWVGENFDELERWIRDRDPSRPIHYERDPSYRNSDFASLMYPSLDLLEQLGRREEPRPDGVSDEDDARRRSLPFLLCEYAHAMGNGPGSLVDYQRILESSDRFCGAFVWEWIDHGFRHTDADGREFFMHGADVDYRPNGGRYCLDGLVFSDRTPSPGLAELKKAIEPVVIEIGPATVTIRNRYDVLSLDHLAFIWRLEVDGEPRSLGSLDLPPVAPGESGVVPLPAEVGDEPGEWWLTVEARLAENERWADAGHLVAWGQGLVAERSGPPTPPPSTWVPSRARVVTAVGLIAMGDARFDARTGQLVRLGGLDLEGPLVDVYRAPIENDRGQGGRNDLAAVWRAVGLDRMQHRTDLIEFDGDVLRVTGRSAAATHPHALDYSFEWSWDDGLRLHVAVDFTGPWADTPYQHREIVPPRLGLRMSLPGAYDTVTWFGHGPGESYVDSQAAARVGRFEASVDELQVRYPVPQENGNHLDTRWLELTGPGLPALRVEGEPTFDFTARRWTSEALERARHPHELVDSGRVWLNLDRAQQGIGSAACGPALPERYRIPRTHTEWSIRLSLH